MLDFVFRRGNPTNDWRRSSSLSLTTSLDVPALNGVNLGSQFEQLSFLGRSDRGQRDNLGYSDLGIIVDRAKDGTFQGFEVIVVDEDNDLQPYNGKLSWKNQILDARKMTQDQQCRVFGDWYWLDSDDDESIAFYEFPQYEMQIELTLSGSIKRIILSNSPLLADSEQRELLGVDKAWPPQY